MLGIRTHAFRIVAIVASVVGGAVVAVPLLTPGISGAATPVALVQNPTRRTTADFPPNTDFVVPWTVAPTAGNTFLVVATHYCAIHPSNTPVLTSDSGGWTQVNHALGTTEGGIMFGKLIVWRWTGTGVPGNVVLQMQGSTSSCDLNVALFEYQGLAANPVDINQQATFDGRPAPWTLPTVTPAQSNELLWVAVGSRASAPWVTGITPGLTLVDNSGTTGGASNMGLAVGTRSLTTTASATPVVSLCSGCGGNPGAVILGLRPAAPTDPTTTTTTSSTTSSTTSTSTSTSTSTTTTALAPTTTTTTTTVAPTTTTTATTTPTTTTPTTTVPPTTTTTTTTMATPPPPTCPCRIWANGVPAVAAATDTHSVELGVKFRSDVNGFVTGLRFYKGAGNNGTHVGNLWSSSGSLLATATFSGETATGWQSVTFSAPVPVTAGTTYVASYHATVGHYAYTYSGLATPVDAPPLHALADVASGGDGVYTYATGSAFPSSSAKSTNYWVDVTFTT